MAYNMKLESTLLIIGESTNVNVIDYDTNEVISHYDGKDSIDNELNDKEVISLYTENNELCVVVLV